MRCQAPQAPVLPSGQSRGGRADLVSGHETAADWVWWLDDRHDAISVPRDIVFSMRGTLLLKTLRVQVKRIVCSLEHEGGFFVGLFKEVVSCSAFTSIPTHLDARA